MNQPKTKKVFIINPDEVAFLVNKGLKMTYDQSQQLPFAILIIQ